MVNTWKIVLAALAIFAAGVITGGITVGVTGKIVHPNQPGKYRFTYTNGFPNWGGAIGTNQPVRGPGSMRLMQVHTALQLIPLTPAQKERTDFLVRETEQILRETWESTAPKMQREVRTLENRIADGLPPEERQAFRDLMKKRPVELRDALAAQTNAPAASTNGTPPKVQ